MAPAWQRHGNYMAIAWQRQATAWQRATLEGKKSS
jgi:hypothetical protein